MPIGFSTGSLAGHDVLRGVQMSLQTDSTAIELSALREAELEPLLALLDQPDLSRFSWISLHAPSKLDCLSEAVVVSMLLPVADRGWSIIVHPDVITDAASWQKLGDRLCLENMDKRKGTGRTAVELAECFRRLPDASFCFDIGHARQVDPTMLEARRMLRDFSNRLTQVHMSYVNSASRHEPLNFEAVAAFSRVMSAIPEETPVILETPVTQQGMQRQINLARSLLNPQLQSAATSPGAPASLR